MFEVVVFFEEVGGEEVDDLLEFGGFVEDVNGEVGVGADVAEGWDAVFG